MGLASLRRLARVAIACASGTCSTAGLDAQQELWRYWPYDEWQAPFGSIRDFDGDGGRDLLIGAVTSPYTVASRARVRLLSSASGDILYDRDHAYLAQHLVSIVALGDVDGDGVDEYSVVINANHPSVQARLEVWSPRSHQMLWSALGPFATSIDTYGFYTCSANLDGDANMEVLTTTHHITDSRVFAYDHDGTLLWTTSLLSFGEQARGGLSRIGDLNGDGRDEIGVGLIEATGKGGVRVLNGANGSTIRVDLGEQVGDVLGWKIVPFGDLDLDGTPDYATSNRYGYPRGLVTIFSGATGVRLRQIVGGSNLAESLQAGFDMDLDGVGDVFTGGPYYFNGESPPGMYWLGRVQAFSGRDGGLLWDEQNWGWQTPTAQASGDIWLGLVSAVLGPIGENPYPVVVFYDRPTQIVGGFAYPSERLRAMRVQPAGTNWIGSGCSSTGVVPDIAVRRDPTVGVRVTLARAQAAVPAWLLIGAAWEGTWQGAPLPMSLAPLGLPGCALRVPPTILFGGVTGVTGHDRGFASVHAPFTLSLTGLPVAAQWLTLDPASLGYAMTARHELHLQ